MPAFTALITECMLGLCVSSGGGLDVKAGTDQAALGFWALPWSFSLSNSCQAHWLKDASGDTPKRRTLARYDTWREEVRERGRWTNTQSNAGCSDEVSVVHNKRLWEQMCHLFDSLWYEATVRFVSKILLIGFSHQQSHFTVEWWGQGQGAILQQETGLTTNSQLNWRRYFLMYCNWLPVCNPSSDPPVWHKPAGSPQQTGDAGATTSRSHRSPQAVAATDSKAALCTNTEPPNTHRINKNSWIELCYIIYFALNVDNYACS